MPVHTMVDMETMTLRTCDRHDRTPLPNSHLYGSDARLNAALGSYVRDGWHVVTVNRVEGQVEVTLARQLA